MLILLKGNSYLTIIDAVSDPGYLFNLNSNTEIAATITVPILQMRKQREMQLSQFTGLISERARI